MNFELNKYIAISSLITLLTFTPNAYAFTWKDLWVKREQQASKLLKSGHPQQAADLFKTPAWQGTARYRAGQYKQAHKAFSKEDTADGHYNRGNALAHDGQLQEAIEAYDIALKHDAKHEDAKYNRNLLQELQKQQQSQSNKNNQHQDEQDQQTQGQKQQQQDKSQQSQQHTKQDQKEQQANDTSKKDNTSSQENQKNSREDAQEFQKAKNKSQTQSQTSASQTKDQETEQWLRQIPDDPGGLLKQKFLRDYQKRHSSG